MGRKHRNASTRDFSKLSVRGVSVQYHRLPNTMLDMRSATAWQHAIALSGALWCRDRYSLSSGVNVDPYGIWNACRFVVTSSGSPVTVEVTDSFVSALRSSLLNSVTRIGRAKGFSEEMILQAKKELGPLPLPVVYFWRVVSLIVGSMESLSQDILLYSGHVRPVWLTPYKVEHQSRAGLPDRYVVVERGVPESITEQLDDVPVLWKDASSYHEYVSVCGGRCLAVIAHSLDGVVLGYAANDRCYQFVPQDTDPFHVLMSKNLQVTVEEGRLRVPDSLRGLVSS